MSFRWVKRLWCDHRYIPRYLGMNVTGFICIDCDKRKYEKSGDAIIQRELSWLEDAKQ